jgi:hypothetical protein
MEGHPTELVDFIYDPYFQSLPKSHNGAPFPLSKPNMKSTKFRRLHTMQRLVI